MKQFLLKLWRDESGGSSIGRLALGIGGAAIGFAVGGPFGAAAFGAQIGFLGGTIVGNILFPQELPDIVGQRLDPNQIMTSAYGNPIPIGFGRFVVGGTVVFYPGFEEHEIVDEQGGKGGGPTQTVRTYTYTGSFRINVCEGPVDAIEKIWANRILIYDSTNTTNPIINFEKLSEPPGTQALRIYLGEETQLPDITEQADKGVGATPAYRGIAGIFFENYGLDDSGGVPPQITALMSTSANEALLSTKLLNVTLNGTAWAWQPGRSSFLIGSGGTSGTTRINNLNQTVMTSNAPGGETHFPAIDSNGDFYTVSDGFGAGGGKWTKFSGENLKQIWQEDIFKPPDCTAQFGGSLNWSHGRMFGGIRAPDGSLLGELMFAARDNSGATMEVVILDPAKREDICGGAITTYFMPAMEVSSSNVGIIAIDDERHLWLISNETGETVLFRIQPGAGVISETHTLTGETYRHLCYDSETNSLILGDPTSHISVWSLDTNTETGRISNITYVDSGTKNQSVWWNDPSSDGRLYLQVSATLGDFKEFNIHDLTVGPLITMTGDYGLSSGDYHVRGIFDESRNALIVKRDGNDIVWLYFDRTSSNLIQVKDIVDPVSARVGLAASDIVTTNLTQQLHGYLIGSRTQAKNALMPLSQMFFFSPVSEDFVIKFPILGGASIATIPEDDLAAGSGDIRVVADRVSEQYLQEIELPELLELGYNNDQAEYQVQYQRAKRPRSTTNTKRKKRLAFPGTFISNSDAAQRLETILYNIWTKRRPIEFSTSQRWLRLSPADVVTVTNEGTTQDVALGAVNLGVNNVIEFQGAADDPTNLTSIATGSEGSLPDQTIPITSAPAYEILDLPLLRAQDDGFGTYVVAGAFGDTVSFPGAEIVRSLDGTDFGPFAFVSSAQAMAHGFANTALPDADANTWDRVNSLVITMSSGTLPSSTEELVLNGVNILLIGNELVAYVNSTDNGDNTFTISTLLRGRKNTVLETGSHVASETVIVMAVNTTLRKGLDLADLNVAYFYKGVSRGGSLLHAIQKTVSIQGKSQWNWAVVHVSGTIAANDWTINWFESSRLTPEWRNLVGVPTISIPEYEVDVLSGPGGTVLKTYTTTATANGSVITMAINQFFYDDADQILDFGSVQTTLTVKIYPLTTSIGRGFPTEVTLVGG